MILSTGAPTTLVFTAGVGRVSAPMLGRVVPRFIGTKGFSMLGNSASSKDSRQRAAHNIIISIRLLRKD